MPRAALVARRVQPWVPILGVVAYLAVGVPEAHAWDGALGIGELLYLATHTAAQGCFTDLSIFGGWSLVPAAPGAPCQGSWLFDLGALGLFFTTVVVVMRMRLRGEERRLELARRFIEQGLTPPAELFPSAAQSDLRRGVVLVAAGLGILAASGSGGHFGAIGLIPGFIGLGYLVSYTLSRRLARKATKGSP